jgi:putative phosphoesterase
MTRIGLLSDTHGSVNPRILDFFSDCDEIWHAGDIGNVETSVKLAAFKPFKAVYGNIDGTELRISYPKNQLFNCEDVKVLITHIGGYPGRYEKEARQLIESEKPGIFISGHSHILKVIYDKKHKLLHINPGAAGNSGFHHVVTCVRFVIDGKDIQNLEVFEKQRN